MLYRNDIADEIGDFLKVKLFADDVKVYVVIDEIDKCVALQQGLDKIHDWSIKWQLSLAASKCQILHIGSTNTNVDYVVNGVNLPKCNSVVDLGVKIDSKIRFDKQIANMVNKANARAALILRSFKTREPQISYKAFVICVRPILEYCSAVWNPSYKCDVQKVEAVQRRFTKKLRSLRNLNYCEHLHRLESETLEVRRIKTDLVTVYSSLNALCCISFSNLFTVANRTCTRGHAFKLLKPNCSINCRLFSFSCRVINIWNSLPSDVVTATSISAFKRQLNSINFNIFLTDAR